MKNLYLLILFIFCLSCKNEKQAPETAELGIIELDVSGKEEALPVFQEAMLLLHSFEYVDAEEKFREARRIDPDFGMAYWGEAMCHNHPLWREQNLRKAKEVLDSLGSTPEERASKFRTDFEKNMFEALSILYGNGSKAERDIAYAEYMKQLHEEYPDNNEISAFYALSVLGSVKGGRDYEAYGHAAKIAQSVVDENKHHPGALHYLIHSYDDPENAGKALDAANAYSKVAPDAGHALHMPSHIYVALGMWDEVIASNIASWEASKKRQTEKSLDNDALNYHAFQWLMYGYLQKGAYDKARDILAQMRDYAYELSSSSSAYHLTMMKAAYFIESGNWSDSLLKDTLDYSKHNFTIRRSHYYLNGMASYHKNDSKALASSIDSLSTLIDNSVNQALTAGSAMCSGTSALHMPNQLDLDRGRVILTQLQALAAQLAGKNTEALALMKEAVDKEQETSYNYGPPEIIKPSSELLAEWLIEEGRIKEPSKQLELVFERAPGRYIAAQHQSAIEGKS